MMTIAACALDPATDAAEVEAQEDDVALASTDQASTSAPEAQAVSCAVVTTCNAAGADGTRCRQQGCSVGAATLECELEAFVVCGAAVCPVILIKLDGTRENLCRDRP